MLLILFYAVPSRLTLCGFPTPSSVQLSAYCDHTCNYGYPKKDSLRRNNYLLLINKIIQMVFVALSYLILLTWGAADKMILSNVCSCS